jgi:hypothetical protein
MTDDDQVRAAKELLRLPWSEHEGPDAYHERTLRSIKEIADTPGFAAILDIIDARERQLWLKLRTADPDHLRGLQASLGEVAFLRTLLVARSTELARRADKAALEAEKSHIHRQQKVAQAVDVALARAHVAR